MIVWLAKRPNCIGMLKETAKMTTLHARNTKQYITKKKYIKNNSKNRPC